MPTDIAGYHHRTKHAQTRYALGPGFLDWTSQPSPWRRFEGAPLVPLPLCDRERTPDFPGPAGTSAPLDARALGLFLELAFGLSAWKSVEGNVWALRNNPSSGNLHPTECYALLPALDGLSDAPGLWHYAPKEHGLEQRARFADGAALPAGGFLIGLSSLPWRESWKYGERAFRYCQLDAGHAIGCAAQAAAVLGWRAQALLAPSDADVASLLGLDQPGAFHRREEEHPDALLWIGAGPPPQDVDALLAGPRDWFGAANRLSEDHDGWPAVDLALRFTRKPRSATPPAPSRRAPPVVAGAPIGDVVRRRRSAQRMDGAAVMPKDNFFAMLAATLPGAEPLMSALPAPPRIALLVFVHRVEGVDPGLYLLLRDADAEPRLRAAIEGAAFAPAGPDDLPLFLLQAGPFEKIATRQSCQQPIAGKGCFSVAMLSDFDRALAEDGPFAYRRLHWEAGLIGQVLYLWASAMGASGTGIGCFFDDDVHALLGLPEGQTQFADVYHFTVGAAVEDARILTLPAYPDERREQR